MGKRLCTTVGPLKWITRYQFVNLLMTILPESRSKGFSYYLHNHIETFKSAGLWSIQERTFSGGYSSHYVLESVWEKYKDHPRVDEEQNPDGN